MTDTDFALLNSPQVVDQILSTACHALECWNSQLLGGLRGRIKASVDLDYCFNIHTINGLNQFCLRLGLSGGKLVIIYNFNYDILRMLFHFKSLVEAMFPWLEEISLPLNTSPMQK